MNIREIEDAKTNLNGWNEDCFNNLRHYLQDVINGVASKEVIAVLSTLEIIEDFKGWLFQLPTTREVLNYKGKPQLKVYPWKENFDWEKEVPTVWQIPDNWNDVRYRPEIIDKVIEEITYINDNIRIELRCE